MRLLVVTAMYPTPARPWWGIAVRREVEALRRRGCGVEVIDKQAGYRGYWAQARRTIAALRSGTDIVHAHFGTSAFVAAAARIAAPGAAPLIVSLHGSDIALGPRPQFSRYWVQYWLSTIGCRGATRVIVQDEAMLSRLPHGLRARAMVLGQAVDPEVFVRSEERDDRRVLFLSDRRRPLKRFALAQAAVAAAATPDIELDSLERHAVDAIPAAMATASVGLLTSEREGMPVAVKEALTAGLRILAVDLPPLRRVADAFPDFVTITRPDAPSLAGALDELLATPAPGAAEHDRAMERLTALGWVEPERTDRVLRLYDDTRARR